MKKYNITDFKAKDELSRQNLILVALLNEISNKDEGFQVHLKEYRVKKFDRYNGCSFCATPFKKNERAFSIIELYGNIEFCENCLPKTWKEKIKI